jgi:hypothetical protein
MRDIMWEERYQWWIKQKETTGYATMANGSFVRTAYAPAQQVPGEL